VNPASSAHVARGGGVYRGRGPRAATLVADHLRAAIVEGEIQAGDVLPAEAVLMEQFGVSRPTLREALRILESEGLLTVNRGSHGGFRVHTPNPRVAAQFAGHVLQHRGATVADILQARAMVESQCARLMAERRTRSDLALLQDCVEEGARELAADGAALAAAHSAFHELVVELSGNETVILMSSMLRHILYQDGQLNSGLEPSTVKRRLRRAQKDHEQLIELIKAGDSVRAEQLWKRHLSRGDDEAVPGQHDFSQPA
jgi:GntR family transcriptional repressor for pyruvate dehydrogenase complex